jgi:tetratricopeptide (TPR) repeat protein
MLSRLSTLSLVAISSVAGSTVAQIPTRSNPNAPRVGAPLVLIATPYTVYAEDSAAAVEAGVGLRERTRRNLGRDYAVVQRDKMNEALLTFGYPADALLDQNAARTLAGRSSSRMLVFPFYLRAGNSHRLTARFTAVGASYGAGHVVSMDRQGNEKPEDLGERVADGLRPAFRAMNSALDCYSNAASDQAKAIAAAQRAIAEIPNFGAAEYCLGEIARSKDSVSLTALAHYEKAVQSDPLSLATYEKMGSIYHLRGDSAKVITTYQTMLQVEPLDQTLRETAFQLFSIYGRPTAAEEVADAGIQRDPNNTDWYDLKSNACLMQEKYSCAVDELERLWNVDSTRADSSFFAKITYAARFGDDTVRFVKWATKGIERYPDHQGILEEAARAYAMSGDADNAVVATRKLLVLNPYDADPIRRTAVLLGPDKIDRVFEFLPAIRDAQDEALSNDIGNLMVNGASAARTAGDTARQLMLADSAMTIGMTNPQLLSYAGFFQGEPLYQQITAMQQGVRDSRSCARVDEYEPLVTKALAAFRLAANASDEAIQNFATRLVPFLETESQAVSQMRQQFCR